MGSSIGMVAPGSAVLPESGTTQKSQRANVTVVKLSTNDDDPLYAPNHVESLPRDAFTANEQGQVTGLEGPHAKVVLDVDEDLKRPVIYKRVRDDKGHTVFKPFANNPTGLAVPTVDQNFVYPNEPRLPL